MGSPRWLGIWGNLKVGSEKGVWAGRRCWLVWVRMSHLAIRKNSIALHYLLLQVSLRFCKRYWLTLEKPSWVFTWETVKRYVELLCELLPVHVPGRYAICSTASIAYLYDRFRISLVVLKGFLALGLLSIRNMLCPTTGNRPLTSELYPLWLHHSYLKGSWTIFATPLTMSLSIASM